MSGWWRRLTVSEAIKRIDDATYWTPGAGFFREGMKPGDCGAVKAEVMRIMGGTMQWKVPHEHVCCVRVRGPRLFLAYYLRHRRRHRYRVVVVVVIDVLVLVVVIQVAAAGGAAVGHATA
jgi:hypothetical protein